LFWIAQADVMFRKKLYKRAYQLAEFARKSAVESNLQEEKCFADVRCKHYGSVANEAEQAGVVKRDFNEYMCGFLQKERAIKENKCGILENKCGVEKKSCEVDESDTERHLATTKKKTHTRSQHLRSTYKIKHTSLLLTISCFILLSSFILYFMFDLQYS